MDPDSLTLKFWKFITKVRLLFTRSNILSTLVYLPTFHQEKLQLYFIIRFENISLCYIIIFKLLLFDYKIPYILIKKNSTRSKIRVGKHVYIDSAYVASSPNSRKFSTTIFFIFNASFTNIDKKIASFFVANLGKNFQKISSLN